MSNLPHRVFSPIVEEELSIGSSTYTVTKQLNFHNDKESWRGVLLWLQGQTPKDEHFLVATQNLTTGGVKLEGYRPSKHRATKAEHSFRHSGLVYTPSEVLCGEGVMLYRCYNGNGGGLLVTLEGGRFKAFEWKILYSPTIVR